MRRRLSAILSADIARFSALMENDEDGTLARVRAQQTDILAPRVAAHSGRVVKFMGDGVLAEFESVVSAVACALEIQDAIGAAQADAPDHQRILYRVGVNSGDVLIDGDDIFGTGVNVAVRLQGLAQPGGVALSREVRDQIADKIDNVFEDMGEHRVKNIKRPVHVFATRGIDMPAILDAARIAICVLPFKNMSGDPEQEYFADGVTEDIITDLSRVSALAVASRNAAFGFKGKSVNIAKVCRQLRCAFVLEGSVRRAGDRVRITAQLIDGKTDSHLWAERYDRDLSDIFALQAEISEAIAAALKARILPEEKKALEQRSTTNAEAYQLYLMARQYSVMGSERTDAIILRLCRRALELDPNYARAWALLAITQTRMHYRDACDDDGEAAAHRALEIDASLAEAHAARGRILANHGRFDKAVAAHERAIALDGDSYDAHNLAGRTYTMIRRHDDAIRCFEKALSLTPADYVAASMVIQNYEAKGDTAGMLKACRRAMARIEKIVAAEPDHGSALGHGAGILALLGETDRAKAWTTRALLLDPDNRTLQYNLACALVKVADYEGALDLLAMAFQRSQAQAMMWAKADTDLDPLRDLPRFRALIADMEARFPAA